MNWYVKWVLIGCMVSCVYGEYDCNRKGYYNENIKKCECIEGFESLPEYDIPNCLYERRSKWVCLLLSMFGGYCGIDQFYLGKNLRGVVKVVFPICLFGIIGYIKMFGIRYKGEWILNDVPDYYYLIPFIIIGLLWVIDVILIIFNIMKDGYGFTLL